MNRLLIILSLALSWPQALLAATNPEVTSYSIPADAVKRGPLPSRDSNQKVYAYFPSGVEMKRENTIGYETFYREIVVKRDLFKNGKKHGIQREWHRNGQPKSESPYNQGKMDGTYKHWNEQGQLIGQYEITQGTGRAMIYDDAGDLAIEETLRDNLQNGIAMEVSEVDKSRSLVWLKDGDYSGVGFSFYPNDIIRSMSFVINTGKSVVHGPYIEFDKKGTAVNTQWFVGGQSVVESKYAKFASADKTLPPYYHNANQYKKFVTPEVIALLQKYRTMPRVKIPLEFDKKGEPLPAPLLKKK